MKPFDECKDTFERVVNWIQLIICISILLVAAITAFCIVAKADSPRTYLCTSKTYSNIYGRKRCGPHKARLVLKEGIAASYKGFSKSYQRKVLRSYECREVSGI